MTASPLVAALRRLTLWMGAAGLLVLAAGCDEASSESEPRRVTYTLTALANEGPLPAGVSGTVTFWELPAQQTLIAVALDGGTTGLEAVHPVELYRDSIGAGGDRALRITGIDGTAGPGTGARIISAPYAELSQFEGHVRIGQSVAADSVLIAAGHVGGLAEGTAGPGFNLIAEPRVTTASLRPRTNSGTVAPDGVPGQVQIAELAPEQTIVLVRLDRNGATGADTGHPVRLHRNSLEVGGPVEFVLTPISGQDPVPSSTTLLPLPYDSLATFNGHVRISERPGAPDTVFSEGNLEDE